jgi:small neutral amino acid transporter SnatA (MarC family)
MSRAEPSTEGRKGLIKSEPVQVSRRMRFTTAGLVVNVAAFVLLAIWVGEPLLRLLGISPAALTATGGIALIYASIPLMRGVGEAPAAEDSDANDIAEPAAETASPRSVLFTPITSPSPSAGPPSRSAWQPPRVWGTRAAGCCCRLPRWPTLPSPD